MLKQYKQYQDSFVVGAKVFLVTKKGEILEGFFIQDRFLELVSLDRSPIDGTEKQGFTVDGELLRPNWCAGKRVIEAGSVQREIAEKIADEIIRNDGRPKFIPEACTSKSDMSRNKQ